MFSVPPSLARLSIFRDVSQLSFGPIGAAALAATALLSLGCQNPTSDGADLRSDRVQGQTGTQYVLPDISPIPISDWEAVELIRRYYPPSLRASGDTVDVLMRVCVSEQGRVERAEVRDVSGDPAAGPAGLEVIRQYRFWPAWKDGGPVAACRNVSVWFYPGQFTKTKDGPPGGMRFLLNGEVVRAERLQEVDPFTVEAFYYASADELRRRYGVDAIPQRGMFVVETRDP